MSKKTDKSGEVEFVTSKSLQPFSSEHIKNAFICEGLSVKELSDKFFLPVQAVETFIQDNNLEALRSAHVKHGLAKLQNVQVAQAEKLMTLEGNFKRMRILQLEKTLEDYMAYYSRYGHFYKVHPLSGEILKDTNGIPMQIPIPNVSKEILALKESVSLSEGLKILLGQIDDIINRPKDVKQIDPDIIDVTNFDNLFKKKNRDED